METVAPLQLPLPEAQQRTEKQIMKVKGRPKLTERGGRASWKRNGEVIAPAPDIELAKQPNLTVEDVTCSICWSIMYEPTTLPCKHSLCMKCYLKHYEETSINCPCCRRRLSIWCRNAKKRNELLDQELWTRLKNEFPELIKAREDEDDLESESILPVPSDYSLPQFSVRDGVICDTPGIIYEELKVIIKPHEEDLENERLAAETASIELIKRLQEEEAKQLALYQKKEHEDFLLAKKLEAIEMKKKIQPPTKMQLRARKPTPSEHSEPFPVAKVVTRIKKKKTTPSTKQNYARRIMHSDSEPKMLTTKKSLPVVLPNSTGSEVNVPSKSYERAGLPPTNLESSKPSTSTGITDEASINSSGIFTTRLGLASGPSPDFEHKRIDVNTAARIPIPRKELEAVKGTELTVRTASDSSTNASIMALVLELVERTSNDVKTNESDPVTGPEVMECDECIMSDITTNESAPTSINELKVNPDLEESTSSDVTTNASDAAVGSEVMQCTMSDVTINASVPASIDELKVNPELEERTTSDVTAIPYIDPVISELPSTSGCIHEDSRSPMDRREVDLDDEMDFVPPSDTEDDVPRKTFCFGIGDGVETDGNLSEVELDELEIQAKALDLLKQKRQQEAADRAFALSLQRKIRLGIYETRRMCTRRTKHQ